MCSLWIGCHSVACNLYSETQADWAISGILLLVIADGKETVENPELNLKLLHRREVKHVISIHISLVKTCHVAKPAINKVVSGILPRGGAMNLCNDNTDHPMIILTPGASHWSCASVDVCVMLDPVLQLRSLHWNPGPPTQMPVRQFSSVALNRTSSLLLSILFLSDWRPTAHLVTQIRYLVVIFDSSSSLFPPYPTVSQKVLLIVLSKVLLNMSASFHLSYPCKFRM